MATHGKKYKQAAALVDASRIYSVQEAVELLERTNTVKFDPTIEIHFNLGIDPKHADQQIRSTISLPNGSGRTVKIGVFTDQGNDKELLALGAVAAGGDDLIETVMSGKVDFDIAIATPNMMKKMGRIAKILGPKGIMPNPKSGTVGEDLMSIVKELQAGKFEYKNDKHGNVHSIAGKLSFGSEKISQNIEHFIRQIRENKPAGVKNGGNFVKSVFVCNAMGPGIRIF